MVTVAFEEVEVGPHFITFYTKDLNNMLILCKDLWVRFKEDYSDYVDTNHPDFAHWDNDPRVYHRFGEPNYWRAAYRHFHINTETRPTYDQVVNFINFVEQSGGRFPEVVPITEFENFKLNKADIYPPRKLGEKYLDYINRLKNT